MNDKNKFRWQDQADKSVVKDGEKGTTLRQDPPKSPDLSQPTPNGRGSWPYR